MCATTLLKERNRRQKMTETDVYMDRPTCSHHTARGYWGLLYQMLGFELLIISRIWDSIVAAC